jgi:hypothetical protein
MKLTTAIARNLEPPSVLSASGAVCPRTVPHLSHIWPKLEEMPVESRLVVFTWKTAARLSASARDEKSRYLAGFPNMPSTAGVLGNAVSTRNGPQSGPQIAPKHRRHRIDVARIR